MSLTSQDAKGLNSIIMMNLTRLRSFKFQRKILAFWEKYRDQMEMADQDLLNVIFNQYPEKLYLLPCTYNFLWSHCGRLKNNSRVCPYEDKAGPICFCYPSLKTGVHVVHGNFGTFNGNEYPLFSNLYRAISKVN